MAVPFGVCWRSCERETRVAFGSTVLLRRSALGFSAVCGADGTVVTGWPFAIFFFKKSRNGIVIIV